MDKIDLSTKLYKYNEYRFTTVEHFDSEEDLKKYIEIAIEEDVSLRQCIIGDDECIKWEQSFEYNGKRYMLAIDL